MNLKLIRELAKARKKPIAEIAKEIGVHPNQLHHMMRVNSTKDSTLSKIADSLGVPVSVFFEDEVDVAAIVEQHHVGKSVSGNVNIIHTENGDGHYKQKWEDAKQQIEALKKEIQLLELRIADKEEIIGLLRKNQG